MKIIKITTEELNPDFLPSQVKIVEDSYELLATEEDITYYEYIDALYEDFGSIDYTISRRCYEYLAQDFTNEPELSKLKICELCATGETFILNYYMSINSALTYEEAENIYFYNKSNVVTNLAYDCNKYFNCSRLKQVLYTHLSEANVEIFLDNIYQLNLLDKYLNFAYYGKKYGNSTLGLLDYIESYDGFDTTGLVSYTLKSGKILAELVDELVDILYYGYTDEYSDFDNDGDE